MVAGRKTMNVSTFGIGLTLFEMPVYRPGPYGGRTMSCLGIHYSRSIRKDGGMFAELHDRYQPH